MIGITQHSELQKHSSSNEQPNDPQIEHKTSQATVSSTNLQTGQSTNLLIYSVKDLWWLVVEYKFLLACDKVKAR